MHNLFVFLVIFDDSNICFINTQYKLILVKIFLFFCSWTHTELGRVSGVIIKHHGKATFRNPEGPNPEGSYFYPSRRVLVLPIRKGPIFTNPEGF